VLFSAVHESAVGHLAGIGAWLNAHDKSGKSTYCPGCSERIIGRDWYDITTWRLTGNGRCGICSTAIPGLFEAHPGNWGQRRVPIRIGRPERS
jgi:pyruvate formate lyase activating enzyme